MLQRHYIDLRIMSKTKKHTIHATREICTDQSIYLCNENQCRQIFFTTIPKQLNKIINTEHPAKKMCCVTLAEHSGLFVLRLKFHPNRNVRTKKFVGI